MSVPFAFPRRLVAGLVFSLLAVAVTAQTPAPAAKAPAADAASGELVLHKWSGGINVPDPVACAVDPQGRVYVTTTTRRKVGDLDIREFTDWIPDDVGFEHIDDKQAFYHRVLAPGKMRAPKGSLKDFNGDGSIDWKDLTVHTEQIWQLRDTDGDGTADKITLFADGFNTEVTGIAAGILYHDGWVYVTIAPDLWRLKDTNDDGVADVREIVAHGFGMHIAYAGHDMHGPMVGPDGRIYWSIGDKGVNVTSKEGRKFYFPNTGAVMRVDPDGANFEVYASGLRNVQEPAFSEFGDLIGVDNDADQPGERERFVHIIEASDSGWRCNYQYMKLESPWMREGLWKPRFPGQAAYITPPLLSYSDGPAGFKHDPGTALGDPQRGIYLLNEFPSGKMRGFRIEREGATFKMVDARVLNSGIMGIGLSWQADGSLMMADWIGGYPLDGLGALWRVDTKSTAKSPQREETKQLLVAGFASRNDAELAKLLDHADQRVRQGAQLELAKRGRAETLLAAARDPKGTVLGRIHGIWGYGQLLRRNAGDAKALAALLKDSDGEIRAQVAKMLGDAATTGAKSLGRSLIPLLNDESPRARLQAGIALGKFREPTAVDPLFALAAREGEDPVMRHAAVAGLQGCATPDQLAAKRTDLSVPVRLAAVVTLRRLAAPEVAGFLSDGEQLVVEDAARAIHDNLGIPTALPALVELLAQAPRGEVITRRAINAALRVGTPAAATKLLTFALNESTPKPMREEALATLRMWPQPPRLDPVDGYARKFKPAAIEAVLTPQLDRLLALSDAGLKTIAVEIMIAHHLKAGADQLAAIVAAPKGSGELSAQALRLMAAQQGKSPAYATALTGALATTTSPALHRAALELLLPGDPARLSTEAAKTLQGKSVPDRQHAIALLARAANAEADAQLAAMGDALVGGTLAATEKLDVIEALKARGAANSALAEKLKVYAASAAATAQDELLQGGDIARGRDIVANHLNANCTACHSVEAAGSEVGPSLRTIGSTRDPAYLLESLLTPSAKIATGYGLVNVTRKDKTEVVGTLAKETPEAVAVRLFDGKQVTVSRSDIASQSPPISIMPPMGAILQPREIRDVVGYLSSLKARGRAAQRTDDGN